jgi:DNA-binding transcriptional LysR family regulator
VGGGLHVILGSEQDNQAAMILSLQRVIRFVTVAEQLSFTRAAAMLRMDQPWLSRQIMQLEEQLGFPLFDRSGARISLTPAGEEFFKTAKEVSDAAARTAAKADEIRRRSNGALRIGVSSASYPMPGREQLLERFAAMYSKIDVEISAYPFSDEVFSKVANGELDFGIVFGAIDEGIIEAAVIDGVEATLAMPNDDPLAAAPKVTLEDLKGRRVAVGLPGKSSPQFQRVYSWMENAGVTPVFVPEGRRFVFDVAAKKRIYVLCYTSADTLPKDFVRKQFRGPHPTYDVSLIRGKRTMSTAAEQMWRLACEQAERHRAASPRRPPRPISAPGRRTGAQH